MSRKTKNDSQGVVNLHVVDFRPFSLVFPAMGKGKGKRRQIQPLTAGATTKSPKTLFSQMGEKGFRTGDFIVPDKLGAWARIFTRFYV